MLEIKVRYVGTDKAQGFRKNSSYTIKFHSSQSGILVFYGGDDKAKFSYDSMRKFLNSWVVK